MGKCPKHITNELAEQLLNEEAVPVYDSDESTYPDCFYAVYRGVIYEAVPTQPGRSYHAYPWRGDPPGRKGLRRKVRRKLEEAAQRRGEMKELERWLTKYGGPGS
ncbi:hypothetical protein [Alkalilimnicola ehrlichii]|uniref:hypothetical protein n=1 Tax=Alkalilimnicola ehrlichii TaxID=351052 RepID=UPI003BA14E8E